MQYEMTELSGRYFDTAASGLHTVQEAVRFLEEQIEVRTFREKLEKFHKGDDLRKDLVDGLAQNHPELSRDSIERRVRGWLNNASRSVRKNDAIEICFILKLTPEEADQFLMLVSEEALHWRSPDEIVYIFALQHGMTYREAQALETRMKGLLSDVKEQKTIAEDSFTTVIRSEVSALQTEEELSAYLRTSAERLGRFHNNAYSLFMEMIGELENPQMDEMTSRAELFEEEHLTVREILREYLYEKNVLYAKEQVRASRKKGKEGDGKVFSAIQESIAEHWPDEVSLSRMKSRKADVTRKVLILLFLATDSGYGWDEDDYDEEPSQDQVFEDLYRRMNDMLLLCGFQTLDPRSPFDWLILYCICVPDIFDVDLRMREIFGRMYGEREVTE